MTTKTTTNNDDTVRKLARRRKRRRGRFRDDPIYFVEVTEWDWSLMFGISPRRDMDGPYSDYRHLNLRGRLVHPPQVKAHEVEITLMPDRRLNEGEREHDEPQSCGSLHLHRGHLRILLPMPLDALPSVLQIACAERLRYVVVIGEKLHYGQGLARMYRLHRTVDEDDLPTDQKLGANAPPSTGTSGDPAAQ
ncbi:hypothetical protein ACNHKD_09795 [Methylocystis sp. JAN1]|uniref:hypothetical protein n=1 Tax=Methylocystis sp. JAN1 TaxID=3397211 RepID=UPI003FA1B29E